MLEFQIKAVKLKKKKEDTEREKKWEIEEERARKKGVWWALGHGSLQLTLGPVRPAGLGLPRRHQGSQADRCEVHTHQPLSLPLSTARWAGTGQLAPVCLRLSPTFPRPGNPPSSGTCGQPVTLLATAWVCCPGFCRSHYLLVTCLSWDTRTDGQDRTHGVYGTVRLVPSFHFWWMFFNL